MAASSKQDESGTGAISARFFRPDMLFRKHLRVRRGEGVGLALFFAYAFLLMVCYYILKTLREPLLLVAASAEAKSYGSAATAVVLFVMVPLYGKMLRRKDPGDLIR
ncbi:MAG: hypothetical protein ACR2QV_04890, partial [Gammaproteobacteria bacterium]